MLVIVRLPQLDVHTSSDWGSLRNFLASPCCRVLVPSGSPSRKRAQRNSLAYLSQQPTTGSRMVCIVLKDLHGRGSQPRAKIRLRKKFNNSVFVLSCARCAQLAVLAVLGCGRCARQCSLCSKCSFCSFCLLSSLCSGVLALLCYALRAQMRSLCFVCSGVLAMLS